MPTEPRDLVPGWEGTTGPFPAQYGLLHVYARDVQSGAGNCVCGRALRHHLHLLAAPGVPMPTDPWPTLDDQPPVRDADEPHHLGDGLNAEWSEAYGLTTLTWDRLRVAARHVTGRTSNARCEHHFTDREDPQGNADAQACDECVRYAQLVIERGLRALGIPISDTVQPDHQRGRAAGLDSVTARTAELARESLGLPMARRIDTLCRMLAEEEARHQMAEAELVTVRSAHTADLRELDQMRRDLAVAPPAPTAP